MIFTGEVILMVLLSTKGNLIMYMQWYRSAANNQGRHETTSSMRVYTREWFPFLILLTDELPSLREILRQAQLRIYANLIGSCLILDMLKA